MSHHFDTPTAREDPRINLCDFYLFSGGPASTVMAMTVNPDAPDCPLRTPSARKGFTPSGSISTAMASNTALGDGVVPDKARIRSEFPYFGEPYTRAEQADVTPAPQHSQK